MPISGHPNLTPAVFKVETSCNNNTIIRRTSSSGDWIEVVAISYASKRDHFAHCAGEASETSRRGRAALSAGVEFGTTGHRPGAQ